MQKALPSSPINTDWKTLYRAAIFESNSSVTPQRIADAEQAILARGRELFYSYGTLEEKEALDDALYALRALKGASQYATAA